MSGQQRPSKKRGILGSLLCCISPRVAESQVPQSATTTTGITGDQERINAAEPSVQQSASQETAIDVEKSDGTNQYVNDNKNRNTQNSLESISVVTPAPLVSTLVAADSQAMTGGDIAPALAKREDGTIDTPVSSTNNLPGQSLPEDVAALMDDEPLTPSSAAITATVPVAAVVDEPTQMVTFGENNSWLLPPLSSNLRGRKCLVLDLDETLVHSSFKIIHQADFVVPVEIDGIFHNVYVIKRPGVDEFMRQMGEIFEIVVFTASLAKYADPVLDILDIHKVVHHRLFRESCHNHMGNYVKDLNQLGRDLKDAIIIDNSPASYVFHPAHAVPISSWFNDIHDTELTDLIPFLEDLSTVDDIAQILELSL